MKKIDGIYKCEHKWLPLVDVGLLDKGYGSMAAQIGYSCDKCHLQRILWKDGHYGQGTEEELVAENMNNCKY